MLPFWKPSGSLKDGKNWATFVHISNNQLCYQHYMSFMSYFPNVIAVGLTDAGVSSSQ